jgi:hypothetical protein
MNRNNQYGQHIYGLKNMWPTTERSWIPLYEAHFVQRKGNGWHNGLCVYRTRETGFDGKKTSKENDCKEMVDNWDSSSMDHTKRKIWWKKKIKMAILCNVYVLWPYKRGQRMFIVLGKQQIEEKYVIKNLYRELCWIEAAKFQKFRFS